MYDLYVFLKQEQYFNTTINKRHVKLKLNVLYEVGLDY